MSEEMVELTGLWLNKDKDGNQYFSGRIGSAKVLIFKNKFKEQENHPDYRLYVTKYVKKDDALSSHNNNTEDEIPF